MLYEVITVIDITDQSTAILALQEVAVPPPPVDPTESVEYRVGPGDVLSVTVPGLLERGNGEGRGNEIV